MRDFQDRLVARIKAGDQSTANMEGWEPQRWPETCRGLGQVEAPRGSLGHWVS